MKGNNMVEKKKKNLENKKVTKSKKNSVEKGATNNKKYYLISFIYIVCSILWFIEGYIKYLNDIKPYSFDFITGGLLLILGIFYLFRYRLDK